MKSAFKFYHLRKFHTWNGGKKKVKCIYRDSNQLQELECHYFLSSDFTRRRIGRDPPEQSSPRETPRLSKDHTGKRRQQSALGKSGRCHQFSFGRDVTRTVARSQSLRGVCPPVGQHQPSCSLFQALLPSSPPLWDLALLGPQEGK